MHVNQSYQKVQTPQYVSALLLCQSKKICTNLAISMNCSHDTICRNFTASISSDDRSSDALKTIASNELDQDNTYLIHHTGVAKGIINGIECYFYAIKIRDESTIYLISNDYIDPYKVIDLYRIRWNIEVFHRTARQYLGLSDCQMRAIEKQRQHALHVMHAYALASVQAFLMGLPCVEDAIKHIRIAKPHRYTSVNHSTEGNLC